MVCEFAGPAMAHLEFRIQQANARHIAVDQLKPVDPGPTDEADLHRVGPPDRTQLPSPSRHPFACVYPEIRVALLHAVNLLRDRRRHVHAGGSVPKNLWDGAANDVVEDAPAMAGAARPDRTTSMRPELRSWYALPVSITFPSRSA